MQLNPARGRKHPLGLGLLREHHRVVYAAQPREGTETRSALMFPRIPSRFMQLNPARGRKLKFIPIDVF